MSDHDDIWYVQLPSGDVRAWDLEQLDAAFQAGTIDESVLVRRDGQPGWVRLADELAATDATEQMTAAEPNSLSPQIVQQRFAQDVPSAPPPPVLLDLDYDLDDAPFKRKSKKGVFIGLAAAAVVGLAAFTAVRINAAKLDVDVARVAAANAISAPTPAPAPSPAVEAPKPAETAAPSRLNDDQKKKVLEADKKRAEERAKRQAEMAEKHAKRGSGRRPKSVDPIRSSGNKFDPLNGAL